MTSPSWSILCSICKRNAHIITDPESGQVICGYFCMVISEKAQDGSTPVWCAFTVGEKNSKARIGCPTSFAVHDMGLCTIIGRTTGMLLAKDSTRRLE
jgi:transcription initiation factor TFIIB